VGKGGGVKKVHFYFYKHLHSALFQPKNQIFLFLTREYSEAVEKHAYHSSWAPSR